jgi:hypothetical protein
MWRGLTSSQRQARKIISDPSPTAKTRLLSCNRIQSRVVTRLFAGHNTLRRHIYIMGLIDSPLCRRCGAEKENSRHVLCECEALATLGHTNLGSFVLDPEDIRSLTLGVIWNIIKEEVSHDLDISSRAQRACQQAYAHRDRKGSNPFTILYYSIIFSSIIYLKYSARLFLLVRELTLQSALLPCRFLQNVYACQLDCTRPHNRRL